MYDMNELLLAARGETAWYRTAIGFRELGFETDMWTGKILAEHIRRKHGMTFVPRTMQTMMHEMGFRHVKPRPRHPKAASSEEKKAFKKS